MDPPSDVDLANRVSAEVVDAIVRVHRDLGPGLLERAYVVEVKAVAAVLPVHLAQLVTYLKLGAYPIGILINFHAPLARDGLHRRVHPRLRAVAGLR